MAWFYKTKLIIWRFMHTSVSMIVLMLVGIHVGLHWNWVAARFKKSSPDQEGTSC
jgi:hypothetical protein